jgi:hypothetical protein
MDNQLQLIDLRRQIIGRLHLNECANQYPHTLKLCDMPPIEKWTRGDCVNSGMEQFETFRRWTRLVKYRILLINNIKDQVFFIKCYSINLSQLVVGR